MVGTRTAAWIEAARSPLEVFIRLHAHPTVLRREGVSDIVQRVSMTLVQRRDELSLEDDRACRSWLLKTAANHLRERLRYWTRQRRSPSREVALEHARPSDLARVVDSVATSLARQEDVERVMAHLRELPENWREVLLLSRVGGLSDVEVAVLRGQSPGAVRTMRHRALSRLAWLLRDDEE